MSQDLSPQPATAAKPGGLLRGPLVPVAIVVADVAALAGIQFAENSERLNDPANAFLMRFSTVGIAGILLFLWFVLFSRVEGKTRLRVGVVGFVLLVVAFGALRIEGVSGNIWPKFRFRWERRADQTLPKAAEEAAGTQVNLLETTPDDYPQFMGPSRRATLENVHLAHDWSAQPPRAVWRQPIGAGWSAFAVVGHYGVTQEQRDKDELITCYDLDTGKLEWAHSTPVRFFEVLAGVGPRATPTIHEGKVYALGALGELTCLDGATGKPLWQHNVLKENDAQQVMWGKSCSPLVHENLVIVSAGGPDGKSLVAYDKESGSLVWSGGNGQSSYSSPTLVTLGGQPQILIVNARNLAAHDPADGHVIWQHPWPDDDTASPNVSQPLAVGDDRLLLSKGYGVGSALWKISQEGDEWKVEELWKNRNLKTKFTSAVVRDGYAYGLDEGILECIEIATGAKKWKQGKYGHGQILLVDDVILVQAESGEVALVEARPEKFNELTRFSAIKGISWNTPALSGRKLLVRNDEEAACYVLPLETQ